MKIGELKKILNKYPDSMDIFIEHAYVPSNFKVEERPIGYDEPDHLEIIPPFGLILQ